MPNADVFIGVSAANALSPDLLKLMAPKPVVFALANPDPEILPSLAHAVRDDILMATGRSDFPNQVNNALCFPYLFRGALDAKAKQITDEMQIAAARALAALAQRACTRFTRTEARPDISAPTPRIGGRLRWNRDGSARQDCWRRMKPKAETSTGLMTTRGHWSRSVRIPHLRIIPWRMCCVISGDWMRRRASARRLG